VSDTLGVRHLSRFTFVYGGRVLVVAATEAEADCAIGAETLVCGVGPVEAALAMARRLDGALPESVLLIGLAGVRGFDEVELALGSVAIYCDAATPSLVPSRARPDPALLAEIRDVLPAARICPIGTTARVGGSSGCDVEAMEGFSVLRACELTGVPAVELRAIVNEIDEPVRSLWRFAEGLEVLRDVVPLLLEALRA
jgi:nucleoside phosphorylase